MAEKMNKDPYEASSDPAVKGYRKIAFGADEEKNYLIEGAYNKQASPDESENTSVLEIAKHQVFSNFYSDKKSAE